MKCGDQLTVLIIEEVLLFDIQHRVSTRARRKWSDDGETAAAGLYCKVRRVLGHNRAVVVDGHHNTVIRGRSGARWQHELQVHRWSGYCHAELDRGRRGVAIDQIVRHRVD